MERGKLQRLPVWIIEHVWAHKLMEIQEVLDPSSWPDVDSQPLSLEDSWRLRVAAAQVYAIMKSRDMKNFQRVLEFLETTYKLLPTLVSAIKHMKIMFGLKTMMIMWMLKEDKGIIDIVSKIGQFFPNKLPQYQFCCSQREMFLMRKNHADFKSFAQSLALDKSKFKDYMKNQMEEQYGERYACKVEDRLQHYLQQLETVLPGDTYIDKIMKKQSPTTEEERLLLEVIASDSTTIGTTLRNLLHCDVATCHPPEISQPPEVGKQRVEIPQISSFQIQGNSSSGKDAGEPQQSEELFETVERKEEEKSANCQSSVRSTGEGARSPQFCSKHQRWVQSILQGCPDECSEELLRQSISPSPLLFQSSSSTSSSQSLTPSDLVPLQPPSQTSAHLHLLPAVVEQEEIGWQSYGSHQKQPESAAVFCSTQAPSKPSPHAISSTFVQPETFPTAHEHLTSSPDPPTDEFFLGSRTEQVTPAPELVLVNDRSPYVSLARLSSEACLRATRWRASVRRWQDAEKSSGEEDKRKDKPVSSFEENYDFFSSDSSSSDCDDFDRRDADYKPPGKLKNSISLCDNKRVLRKRKKL